MDADVPRGRQLGPDALRRQVDPVIAGERRFVLMGKLDIEPVPIAAETRRTGNRHDQELPAVGGSGADEPHMAKAQEPLVAVEISRTVEGPLSAIRDRVGAEAGHSERDTGRRRFISAEIKQATGSNEGVHVPPKGAGTRRCGGSRLGGTYVQVGRCQSAQAEENSQV